MEKAARREQGEDAKQGSDLVGYITGSTATDRAVSESVFRRLSDGECDRIQALLLHRRDEGGRAAFGGVIRDRMHGQYAGNEGCDCEQGDKQMMSDATTRCGEPGYLEDCQPDHLPPHRQHHDSADAQTGSLSQLSGSTTT